MKELKEFIQGFDTDQSIESIVTFFVDHAWFGEKLTYENGKIILSDVQMELFTKHLHLFLQGTPDTLYQKFCTKFPETNHLFSVFTKEVNLDEECRYYIIDFLLYRLTKDLFLYQDTELEELITYATFELIKGHGDVLTFFLAWMRLKRKTAYQKDYTMNKRYTMDIQNQAYDFDDYIQLLYYLFVEEYIEDNNMFQKAAESKNYTDTWLYLALHFIRPLRLTDMVRIQHPILPYPAKEVIEKVKNDTFTPKDATLVLLSVTDRMNYLQITPNKTDNVNFVVPITFDIPMSCQFMIGKLFALAQAHRDILGEPEAPIVKKVSTYQEIKRYMGDEIGDLFLYNDFRSRSATKSFLQDICMVADEDSSTSEESGIRVKGYYLAALARRHKGSYGEFAQTTFEYLKDAKFNKLTPEFIAFEIMERGVFSFMSTMLLKMALGEDFKKLSPQNQTKIIKTVDLTPKEIESLVTIVDGAMTKAQTTLKELVTKETDILTVLHKIGSGEAISKQSTCSCLMTALGKPCIDPHNRNCPACNKEISTLATFFLMISEYNRLRNLYRTAKTPQEKAKYKNLLNNVVIEKLDEMLSVIRMLYGEEMYNNYNQILQENT